MFSATQATAAVVAAAAVDVDVEATLRHTLSSF
jgi:hypothetical protein